MQNHLSAVSQLFPSPFGDSRALATQSDAKALSGPPAMELLLLGTSSMMPTQFRNMSSCALRYVGLLPHTAVLRACLTIHSPCWRLSLICKVLVRLEHRDTPCVFLTCIFACFEPESVKYGGYLMLAKVSCGIAFLCLWVN